eukprot:2143010-Pyramimonas_sp.AAC.1
MWLSPERRAHPPEKSARDLRMEAQAVFKTWLSPQRRAHPSSKLQDFTGGGRFLFNMGLSP